MIYRIAIFSWVILMSAISAPGAMAIGEDVFVVPRVPVQAQASNATAAKNLAQATGRRKAIDILLRRLTVEEDWIYLPRYSTGEAPQGDAPEADFDTGVMQLDDQALEQLESGFEVYNEKSSSTTYRAFITYRFKPASIRKLLRDARIPYSEAQTRTALVLPVLETTSGLYLWEENNPWMAAWKVRPYNNELTPMSAPLGDLEDAATITARKALSLDQDGLQAMAERYNVSQVIVAHAFLQQSNGEDVLRIRLVNGIRESGELASVPEFSDDPNNSAAYDYNQLNNAAVDPVFQQARVGDTLAEEWFRRPSGNFPSLAEEAIEIVIAKHAKPWKEQTLINHTEAALLEASAYFQSISEWTKIRSALVSTPLIGSIQVRSLSRRGAEMLIQAYGDPSKLIVAMEAQGLALWTENGEVWMIATPATAQQVRSASFMGRRERLGSYNNRSGQAVGVTPASYPEEQSTETRY